MTTNSAPLRYNIANWKQLSKCLSNNSRDLYITVSEINGDTLSGVLIEVKHSAYGTLFAAIPQGSGRIVSKVSDCNMQVNWMTTEAILEQLAKFGFFVYYNVARQLPGKMIQQLTTLNTLGYDHLTKINVIKFEGSSQIVQNVVVAFNVKNHADWLSFGCPVAEAAFKSATACGECMNVSALTENLNWDWLTYVATINDILDEQAGIDPV